MSVHNSVVRDFIKKDKKTCGGKYRAFHNRKNLTPAEFGSTLLAKKNKVK